LGSVLGGRLAPGLALCAALAGCAAGTGALDAAAPAQPFAPIALPVFGETAHGKPSEVYVTIARLAKACWFAPPFPLQQGYVFTADVSPDSRGGAARIVIFEHRLGKTHGANAERGEVAYEITLSPAGEDTAIAVVNSRIADDFAERMKNDVHRWAAGETACGPQPAWTVKAAAGDTDPAGGKPAPKPARALAR